MLGAHVPSVTLQLESILRSGEGTLALAQFVFDGPAQILLVFRPSLVRIKEKGMMPQRSANNKCPNFIIRVPSMVVVLELPTVEATHSLHVT